MSKRCTTHLVTENFFACNVPCGIALLESLHTSDIIEEVQEHVAYYERIMSHTMPDSELSFLNNAQGLPINVTPELASVIGEGVSYAQKTNGLVDITAAPLVKLWDFRQALIPLPDEIAQAKQWIDYRRIQVQGTVVSLGDPHVRIMLGAIAKGWIADQVCSFLQQRGQKCGIINLGGNLRVFGRLPDKDVWEISVTDAHQSHKRAACIFADEGSFVTSGITERVFMHEDTCYHHIIDLATGYPAETDIASVTVCAKSAMQAEGYSTALIVMGFERASEFVETLEGVEALFQCVDGRIRTTSGLVRASGIQAPSMRDCVPLFKLH